MLTNSDYHSVTILRFLIGFGSLFAAGSKVKTIFSSVAANLLLIQPVPDL
jgi:hypothetical protein